MPVVAVLTESLRVAPVKTHAPSYPACGFYPSVALRPNDGLALDSFGAPEGVPSPSYAETARSAARELSWLRTICFLYLGTREDLLRHARRSHPA